MDLGREEAAKCQRSRQVAGWHLSCPRGGRCRPETELLILEGRHLRLWTVTHSHSLGACVSLVLPSPESPLGPAGWEHGNEEERDPQWRVNQVSKAETRLPGGSSQSPSSRTSLQGSGLAWMEDRFPVPSGCCLLLPEGGSRAPSSICSAYCGITS